MNQINLATVIFTFVAAFLCILLIGAYLQRRSMTDADKVKSRLNSLDHNTAVTEPEQSYWEWVATNVPKLAQWSSQSTVATSGTREMLLRAAYFHPNAILYYQGVKIIACLTLLVAGTMAGYLIQPNQLIFPLAGGLLGLCLGMIAPSIWLRQQVRTRQHHLAVALPDALDMLVLCIDGGTSFQAAFQRVSDELEIVHPALGLEFKIVLREMQLGLSAGDSLMKFANRCALEDVHELALIIVQSERFGASLSKALRTHAETARIQRQQRAEEKAQKAAVKIIFPTMLCIFPAIFIVILGPVAYQTAHLFAR